MKANGMPSKEVLDQVFRYKPDTGELIWRVRRYDTVHTRNVTKK